MSLNECNKEVSFETYSKINLFINMEERTLIQLIQSGKKDEFRHLVMKYKDLIFSMIMRQTGNHAVSEELTQEVFIKAYTSIKKFKFNSAFSTWLTRIALNHTSSYFSSKRFKNLKMTDEFDMKKHQEVTAIEFEEEEKILANEKMLQRFRAALIELKQMFREVIVLCSLEGKTYQEAAQILNVPVGTIRSRLNKARLQLKQSLER